MKGPEWANGCDKCKYGIVNGPSLTGVVTFALERLVNWIDGELELCDCRAGQNATIYLSGVHLKFIEEAEKTFAFQTMARQGTHPEIESARRQIHQKRSSVV